MFPEENTQESIVKKFGMKIPTQVRINFTEDLLKRMMATPKVMESNRFNTVEYISSTRRDNEHSFIELFDEKNEIIECSKYDDFDTQFNTFDEESFSIVCQSIYDYSFEINMLYVNSWTEFPFSTKRFSLSKLNDEIVEN